MFSSCSHTHTKVAAGNFCQACNLGLPAFKRIPLLVPTAGSVLASVFLVVLRGLRLLVCEFLDPIKGFSTCNIHVPDMCGLSVDVTTWTHAPPRSQQPQFLLTPSSIDHEQNWTSLQQSQLQNFLPTPTSWCSSLLVHDVSSVLLRLNSRR